MKITFQSFAPEQYGYAHGPHCAHELTLPLDLSKCPPRWWHATGVERGQAFHGEGLTIADAAKAMWAQRRGEVLADIAERLAGSPPRLLNTRAEE